MVLCFVFFFNDTATTEIYTLSLHDALPISAEDGWTGRVQAGGRRAGKGRPRDAGQGRAHRCRHRLADPSPGQHPHHAKHRSEEHTSELQSPCNLVCRLLLEKKKKSGKNISKLSHT